MQKDFTYDIYSGLIASLKKAGYVFLPFIDFISNNNDCKKCVVIRHDVDRSPENALKMARMENSADVRASYYFRNHWYTELLMQNVKNQIKSLIVRIKGK